MKTVIESEYAQLPNEMFRDICNSIGLPYLQHLDRKLHYLGQLQ